MIGVPKTIRLTGEALEKLRHDCFVRDNGQCQKCRRGLFYIARFAGDPQAFDLAHIKSRGAGGSDVLANLKSLCHRCHMLEHAGGKPCKAKESAA